MLKIYEDEAQKIGKHVTKNVYWQNKGVLVERVPLPVGDYILANEKTEDLVARKTKRGVNIKKMDFLGTYNVCVDTKKDIQELVGDICGKDHERFRDECILAQNNGIKLYIVVENEFEWLDKKHTIYNKVIRSIDDLFGWKNKRAFVFYKGKQKYPNCTKGSTLAKACLTMQNKYGVEFIFCHKQESGAKVIELLQNYTKE